MEIATPETVATDEVVGVDLGIASPAVDSRGSKYGSEHWKEIEDRTFELRRRLQSKGTKSAKRHLKKLSGRQRRLRKDCDHLLSKRLARSVQSGTTWRCCINRITDRSPYSSFKLKQQSEHYPVYPVESCG
jgi:transposase